MQTEHEELPGRGSDESHHQYAVNTYIVPCDCIQRAEFKRLMHESCERISQNLSSRGETADRFEASGVEAGCSGVAPHSLAHVFGTGDTLNRMIGKAARNRANARLNSSRPATAGVAPGLASSLVVTRCRPLITSMAADLGALGNTFRRASFCSHEYRRACNSLERKSSRIAQKFLTRAAAGLQSTTSLGFLTRASGIAGQSSPLSIRPRRATGLSGGWARPYSPLELSSSLSQSRARPVPESQSAVTPVGISGSARGLGSAA